MFMGPKEILQMSIDLNRAGLRNSLDAIDAWQRQTHSALAPLLGLNPWLPQGADESFREWIDAYHGALRQTTTAFFEMGSGLQSWLDEL